MFSKRTNIPSCLSISDTCTSDIGTCRRASTGSNRVGTRHGHLSFVETPDEMEYSRYQSQKYKPLVLATSRQ